MTALEKARMYAEEAERLRDRRIGFMQAIALADTFANIAAAEAAERSAR